MSCEYCDMIAGKKEAAKVYEDDKVIAFLSPTPATIGHIVITPKKHVPIFEGVEDAIVEHVSKVANKISIALFEAIKCEGTNLIIQNGMAAGQETPHFSANILARRSGDGFIFEWAPKPLNEEEMAAVELQLKQELEAKPAEKMPEPAAEEKKEETAEKKDEVKEEKPNEEDNYLVRQLKRMP